MRLSTSLLAFIILFTSPAAHAQQAVDNITDTTLRFAGKDAESPALRGLVDIDIADGWHTYWRTPGESGLAPTFSWEGSENLAKVDIFYPAPVRDTVMDIHTFIYPTDVALPIKVLAADATRPVVLKGKADYMVCKDICVPETDTFSLTIAPTETVTDGSDARFAAIMKHVPQADTVGGATLTSGVLGKDALVIAVTGLKQDEKVETFVEHKNGYFLRPPSIKRDKDRLLLTFAGPKETDLGKELAGQSVVVTLVIGEGDTARVLTRSFTF